MHTICKGKMKPLTYGISAILCGPSGKGKSTLLRQLLANYQTLLAPKLPREIVMFVERIEPDAAPYIAAAQHGRVDYDSSAEEDTDDEDGGDDGPDADAEEELMAAAGPEGEATETEEHDGEDDPNTVPPPPPPHERPPVRHRPGRRRRGRVTPTYLEMSAAAMEQLDGEPAPVQITLPTNGHARRKTTRLIVRSHASLVQFKFASIPARSVVIIDDLSVALAKALHTELLKIVNYLVHHKKLLFLVTTQSVVASPYFGLLRNFSGIILQLGTFNNVALLQQIRIRYIQDGNEKIEFNNLMNTLLHVFGPDEFFYIFGNLPKKLVPYHKEIRIFCRLHDPRVRFWVWFRTTES